MPAAPSPRRWAVALVVFVACGGLGGAVAVADAGAAGPDLVDGTIALPGPHAGDRGRYESSDLQGNAGSIEFAFLGEAPLRGTDPALVAHRVWIQAIDVTGRQEEHVLWARPSDGMVLARQSDWNDTRTDGDDVEMDGGTVLEFWHPSAALPCGLRHALQGRTVRLDETLPGDFACAQAPFPGPLRFMAIHEGPPRSVLARDDDTQALSWFREGIPYPVRMDIPGPSGAVTWTLTRFSPGASVLSLEDKPLQPLPPLRWASRQQWGPDDSGMDGFRLSEAFQRARDDEGYEGLRRFLAAHPDAYVAQAWRWNVTTNTPDGSWDDWSFVVTDGVEELEVNVRRERDRPPVGVHAWGHRVPVPAPRVTWRIDDEGERAAQGRPSPDLLPHMAPTVASMVDAWRAHTSAPDGDPAPGYWAFNIACQWDAGRPCAVHESYRAGFQGRNVTERGGPTPLEPNLREDSTVFSYLLWTSDDHGGTASRTGGRAPADGDGAGITPGETPPAVDESNDHSLRLARHQESQRLTRPRSPAPALPAAGEPDPAPLAPVASGSWRFLATASVGGGGLLAVLYLLWPALKGAAGGLFTRMAPSQVLEHPVRRRLMACIEGHPGIHHNQLARAAGARGGAARHHLDRLVSAGLVTRFRGAGFTCYFPKATATAAQMAAPVLKSPVARGLLHQAHAHPGLTTAQAAVELGVTPATVHYHTDRLSRAGLLALVPQGRTRLIRLTPQGSQWSAG